MVVDLPFIKSSLKLETIYTMIKLAAAEHQEQGVIAELRFKKVFYCMFLFSTERICANIRVALSFCEAFL